MARKLVELGQRFREADKPRSLWEVEFLYNDGHGVPHARLRNLLTKVDERTYSCSVIMDTKRFKPVVAETP
ncbi:MAG: hypothetical protein VR70_02335 [Rhodospirillaceae bacterium BRH_c57]|nr:MAG: hypothetical protein VR70_02335 [Rhodospirillaceae bacterium BRH_c57]